MKGLENEMTRRNVNRLLASSAVALGAAPLAGCGWWSRDNRSFFIRDVFAYDGPRAARDVAFTLVEGGGSYLLDYVDYRPAQELRRKFGFRVFTYAIKLGATFAVPVPGGPLAFRASLIAGRFLVNQLRSHAMSKALALAVNGGYNVLKVGPARISAGTLRVTQSAACYGVVERKPSGLFDREIAAVPAKINYFTRIQGARRDTGIVHVWRRDGKVTDRIPLKIGSDNWRTWSRKRNLAPGAWILTTEVSNGQILDSREFHISA